MPEIVSWLQTPAGAYLREWEERVFGELVSDIFGYRALQVGWPELALLAANRMPLRLCCDRQPSAAGAHLAGVLAEPFALPFASASLDLVLLPHVLEWAPHPHQVLREVERVLVAEGSLLISGFNPWSGWGLRRLLSRTQRSPWRGRYHSTRRMADWLKLLGFEIEAVRRGCSVPPFGGEDWFRRLRWLDGGSHSFRPGAGVWVVHGIKRVHGMRLLTPQWRDAPATARSLGAVSSRSADKSWPGGTEC